ncbi:MAG: TonB-dependent receptor, partial [Candidatus Korobacteraceae bacterium]
FELMPVINITGLFGFGGAANNGEDQHTRTLQWADQLSWVRGRHSMRFGYQGERFYWDARVWALARGSMSFQTFPDFMLGMSAAQNGSAFSNINNSSALIGSPSLNLKANSHSLFVQDDIKVNQRLTLNLGVRWEYMGLIYDSPKGNTHNADWDLYNMVPIPPAEGTYVGLSVGKNYPGQLPPGVYRRVGDTQLRKGHSPFDNFAPRIGVAWQPLDNNGRLVVRAGYGWFFTRVTFQEPQAAACCGPPQTMQYNYTGAANVGATFQNPFPPEPPIDPTIPRASTVSNSGGPYGFGPWKRTVDSRVVFNYGIDPDQEPPLVQTWNLNTQYGLTRTLALEVGYVNSRIFRQAVFLNRNVPQLATATSPVNCGLPTGCITTNTAANAVMRVPVIGLVPAGVKEQVNAGTSQHHALQVELRKRMSRGLQLGAAYTFGRTWSDVGGDARAHRNFGGDINTNLGEWGPRERWGLTAFTRPHRLVFNYNYQLPTFQNDQGFLGRALSGWALSGVWTVQSGTPLTITDPAGGAIYGFAGASTAQFCSGMSNGDVATSGKTQDRLNSYFNASAFCNIPTIGVVNGVGGATGYGNSRRSIVFGPGQNNWDMAISKGTRIGLVGEEDRIEFRAEFFNTFNTPQFDNPGTTRSTGAFGQINSTAVGPRIIQFALKYVF